MATNYKSSSNPRAENMGDVLDALSSGIAKTAASETKPKPLLSRDPGRTCLPTPNRKNARRSWGVFSRTPSALAHRRRGPAVLEDRGEGAVPGQRH
jgi:hypothetical protein